MEIEVSVVVPVYNVGGLLVKCVESLEKQSIKVPYEVILIDDGSTDDSGALCDELKTKYDNISVIHQDNKGIGGARNTGIKRATGKYICFVDSDDTLEKDYLHELVCCMQTDLSDLVICGYKKVFFDNSDKDVCFNEAPRSCCTDFASLLVDLFQHTLLFVCWNKLYKTSIIRKHDMSFPTTANYEDSAFVYDYLKYCTTISYCDKTLYNYISYPKTYRKTAVKSFQNDVKSKGIFLTYRNGVALAQHMKNRKMNSASVSIFEGCLRHHLESCLTGQMLNGLGNSDLKLTDRNKYVRGFLNEIETQNVVFSYRYCDRASRLVRFFSNHGLVLPISFLSLLFGIKHKT